MLVAFAARFFHASSSMQGTHDAAIAAADADETLLSRAAVHLKSLAAQHVPPSVHVRSLLQKLSTYTAMILALPKSNAKSGDVENANTNINSKATSKATPRSEDATLAASIDRFNAWFERESKAI